ncbi:MAG: hypothetical protein ACYC5Y_14685 [Symbiobacteriia bacterium]
MSGSNDPRFNNYYSWMDHAGEGYHKIQERRFSSALIGLVVVTVIALVVLFVRG